MKEEKKMLVDKRQKNIAVLRRNKKLLKINVLILSVGLALAYIGQESTGEPLIWLGIIIFIYTMLSGFFAKRELKNSYK